MLTTQPHLAPTFAFTRFFTTASLATVFIWFGLMNFTGTSAGTVEHWIGGHMVLHQFKSNAKILMYLLGIAQILTGLIIALHSVPEKTRRLALWAIIAVSIGALSFMLTNPVWVSSLGGFPAIGAGQGLIKYVTVIGVALWALHNRHAETVILIGLVLVLGWIGAMKFTAHEAHGILPLLKSSPAFSWLLSGGFTERSASNLIGGIEIATAVLLTARYWNDTLYGFGLLFAVYTFAATLSFLVTYHGAWTGAGFPYLTAAGEFLVKDFLLMAGTLILACERK